MRVQLFVKDAEANLGSVNVLAVARQLIQTHCSVQNVDLSLLPMFHLIARPVKAAGLSTHLLQCTVRGATRR